MKYIATRLRAPNDRNGNPRRLFLVVSTKDGNLVGVHDEGYKGRDCVPTEYREAARMAYTVDIGASEYKEWLKRGAHLP